MINSRDYQTVIVRKEQVDRLKKRLQKRTRAPLVKMIEFAVSQVIQDEKAEEKLMQWLEKEAS